MSELNDNLADAFEQDARDNVRAISPSLFHPTLVVGFGGTGNEVVRRMKRRFSDRYGSTSLLRYMVVDQDERTYQPMAGLPDLEPSEMCQLSGVGAAAIGANLKRRENAGIRARVPEDLPVEKLALLQGCGGIRALGLLSLLANFHTFSEQAKTARSDLAELGKRLKDALGSDKARGMKVDPAPHVYVVSSVAGGAGAGMFIDGAIFLRELLGAERSRFTLLLAMPSVFERVPAIATHPHSRRQTAANGYACLREIQHLTNADSFRNPLRFDYPNEEAIILSHKLFDNCLLVERRAANGAELGTSEEVFELMGSYLVQEIGSPVGAKNRSTIINANLKVDHDTGEIREFGTISRSSLRVPVGRILKYCAYRSASAALGVLTAPTQSMVDRERTLHQFLIAKKIEERGDQNWPTEAALLRRAAKNQPWTATLRLDRHGLKQMNRRDFCDRIQALLSSFRSMDLEKIRGDVEENLREWQQQAESALAAAAESWAREVGVAETRARLDRLVDIFEETKRELETEGQARTARTDARKSKGLDVESLLVQLGKMGRLTSWFTGRDERLRADIIKAAEALIRDEAEGFAQTRVMAAFSGLAERVKPWRDGMRTVEAAFRGLAARFDAESESVLASVGMVADSGFVLDLDAIDAPFVTRFYGQHAPPSEELAKELFKDQLILSGLCALRQSEIEKRTVARLLDEIIAPRFLKPVRALHIADVLADDAEKGLRKLSFALDACQAFWRVAHPGPMDFLFHEILLVTAPGRPGKGGVSSTDSLLKSWLSNRPGRQGLYQTKFEDEVGEDPWSIEFTRQTQGARAHYLESIRESKLAYREALASKGSHPVHLGWPGLSTDDLDPLFPRRDAEELRLFALAMAFGLIARRGTLYYVNLLELRSKRGSAWKLHSPSDEPSDCFKDSEQAGKLLKAPSSRQTVGKELRLGESREAAMDAFSRKGDFIDLMGRYLAEFVDEHGGGPYVELLGLHAEALRGRDVQDEALRKQYDREWRLLQDEIARHEA